VGGLWVVVLVYCLVVAIRGVFGFLSLAYCLVVVTRWVFGWGLLGFCIWVLIGLPMYTLVYLEAHGAFFDIYYITYQKNLMGSNNS
jgi:hypothetical protein